MTHLVDEEEFIEEEEYNEEEEYSDGFVPGYGAHVLHVQSASEFGISTGVVHWGSVITSSNVS